MLPHEFLSFSKALGGHSTCQKSGARQPLSGAFQLLQDLMLGLAHESTRRNRWVGRRKQRPTSEPDSEISDVGNHRRIKEIGRPELPARPTLQPPEEFAARSTQGASERPSWLNRVEFHREGHDFKSPNCRFPIQLDPGSRLSQSLLDESEPLCMDCRGNDPSVRVQA